MSKSCLAFSLCAITLASQLLHADTPQECPPGPELRSLVFRHVEAKGIGYHTGYSTLEAFIVPAKKLYAVTPFVDLRYHVFNNGKMAANAGIGLRGICDPAHAVFGGNIYYDYRGTHRHDYHQMGAGIESLGRILEVRVNGYIPFGDKRSNRFNFRPFGFSGHRFLFQEKFEYSLRGADGEVGAHLTPDKRYDLFLGAGPYFFETRCHHNAFGGKVRFNAKVSKYFSFEGRVSYDPVFHGRIQGEVFFTLPLGSKFRKSTGNYDCAATCSKLATYTDRLFELPVRQEIIVVSTCKERSLAVNPVTDEPWYFVFVNNTSSSDGTFESPYPTLIQAQDNSGPNDIIYVYKGDGTTNGMDEGITLQDGQMLWGSGINHPLVTTDGIFIIDAMSIGAPNISNTSGNVVTLANNNVVSGFNITSQSTYQGINAESITNATIVNNNITIPNTSFGGEVDGMYIYDCSGQFTISNNTVTNPTGFGSFGIDIYTASNGIAPLSLTIDNNIVTNFGEDNIIVENDGNGVVTATIANNTISNGSTGIDIYGEGSGSIFATISNNSLTGNSFSTGIYIENDGTGPFVANMSNNTMINNNPSFSPYGIEIYGGYTGSIITTIANSTFFGNYIPIYLKNDDGGTFTTSITNNTFTNAQFDIVDAFNYGTGPMSVSILNNEFSNINNSFTPDTIEIYGESSGPTNLTIAGNAFSNCNYPIYFENDFAGTFTSSVTNNTFLNSMDDVILIYNEGTGPMSLSILNNELTNNTPTSNDGIFIYGANNNTINMTISNNNISNITGTMNIQASNSSSICLDLVANIANVNAGPIYLVNSGGTSFDVVGNPVTQNPQATIMESGVITQIPGPCP